MVRMTALTDSARAGAQALECQSFEDTPWNAPLSLSDARVALISSAGLMHRTDTNVKGGTGDYRVIENTTPDNDILVNHVSVNFDRTGYQQDINVVLPRDRLRECVDDGIIAGMSAEHYAFMGATEPVHMREHAVRLADRLHAQGINTVCLLPV